MGKYIDNINDIRDRLDCEDAILQLAEELSEASAAVCKWLRILNGNNPSPKTLDEAIENAVEEISDVRVCMDVLSLCESTDIMRRKAERWANRLEARE